MRFIKLADWKYVTDDDRYDLTQYRTGKWHAHTRRTEYGMRTCCNIGIFDTVTEAKQAVHQHAAT